MQIDGRLTLALTLNVQHHLTFVGELDGITHKVDDDLSQTNRVAEDTIRQISLNMAAQFQFFLMCARGKQAHCVFEGVAETEVSLIEIELPCFDLREIEQVIDQGEQGIGGILDRAQVFALLAGELSAQGKLGHAHDRVHRRANLVAHVGEELTLGFGRFFRYVLCGFQLARIESQRCFCLRALDKLADLTADCRQELKQLGVGLSNLMTKELEHPEHLTAEQNWKAEGTMQAFSQSDRSTREIGVSSYILDPKRIGVLPNTAGETSAAIEGAGVSDGR